MEINLAKSAGFCFGVKRAIKIALETAQKDTPIEMLGDIVHNEEVIKQVSEKGIQKVSISPQDISGICQPSENHLTFKCPDKNAGSDPYKTLRIAQPLPGSRRRGFLHHGYHPRDRDRRYDQRF